jgi:hypothetical protein
VPLPDVIVIGGMKCGTTALHGYLADHPQVAMSKPKELNFFFGDRPGGPGNWWRGRGWYAARFAEAPAIRGESSPGYTSPAHPGVAERMASVVPGVRLLYVARDPLERAVSQYLHHRRDGDEPRDLASALLDPGSQYIARSRHAERLRPFLDRFPHEQIRVLEHRDLLEDRRATLGAIFGWLGLPEHWTERYTREPNASAVAHPPIPDAVADRFRDAVADDAERFERLMHSDVALRPVRA